MGSLNSSRKGRNRTVTHEGGKAILPNAKTQLERSTMACMLWEDTFYEDGEAIADRIIRTANTLPVSDVIDVMLRAKKDMHLRHAPLWLLNSLLPRAEEARREGEHLADLIDAVCTRPDDMTELLSMYWKGGKKPLSAQLKKGLAKAFTHFDAYQLAKYNRQEEITLKDILFLSHAKPLHSEQEEEFKQLISGTLPIPNTWEVRISECGKNAAAKRAVWEDMLTTGKLPTLAFLRNLRNMLEVGVSKQIIRQYFKKHDEWPRISPFQFITAFRYAEDFAKELETAMFKCVAGKPQLTGHTLLMIDVSGSMDASLSRNGTVSRLDAAIGLGIILREQCESLQVVAFGTNSAKIPAFRGLGLATTLKDYNFRGRIGYGTNTGAAYGLARTLDTYDRVLIVTDEQAHDTLAQPQKDGYIINVGSYEPSISYGKWYSLTGWSDRILDYILRREQ